MSEQALSETPDYSKYPAGLAGYTGVEANQMLHCSRQAAMRARIGWRGLYKPGLALPPNGDLLASPCYEDKESKRWKICLFRSEDEGITWKVVETEGDPLMGKEPLLTCLNDGTLLLLTSHPHGFRIHRCERGNSAWRTSSIGPLYEEPYWEAGQYETVRSVLEEGDTLTMLLCQGNWSDLSAPPCRAWFYRSTDKGRTWQEHCEVKAWQHPSPMFGEASLLRLSDGRLLAASRLGGDHLIGGVCPPRGLPTPGGDESGDHMVLFESEDGGINWEGPRPLLNYSEVHGHLLGLKDGRILCTYASYHLPFGVFAVLSGDGGRTWDTDHPLLLALSLTPYCGWPTSIQLPSGEIVTAYAITAYQEGEGAGPLRPGFGDTVAESVRWNLP